MKRIVVVGGGFAGSLVARKLESKFEVTLIDNKPFFEFTPSILRTIIDPTHVKKIQKLHTHYLHKAKVVLDTATSISSSQVMTNNHAYPFDYCVITTGSSYTSPIKSNVVIATRANELKEAHEKLENAKDIVIIGGGLVGVELAGEILSAYPQKKLTIIQNQDKLIPRMPRKAINYATRFLLKRGVRICFGEKCISQKGNLCITDKKNEYSADLVFLCTGIKPNYELVEENFKTTLSDRKLVQVNEFLQLEKNIFVAGDLTAISEEKTAQNAEHQASVVVHNICNLEHNKPLKAYNVINRPMVVSLGKYSGIFTYGSFVFTGIIPALLKSFIEFKEMKKFS